MKKRDNFLEPWRPRNLSPRPELFEVGFGLPATADEVMAAPLVLRMGNVEVRVSGRIDRVDVVEMDDGQEVGFWVIDYKTGRGGSYSGVELKEFRRLQLTLYALAVERVLLVGRRARPLGLAYWLAADIGPKPVLPGHPRHLAWLDDSTPWAEFAEELQQRVVDMVRRIRGGQFPLRPHSRECTQTCDFGQVCRISQSRAIVDGKTWPMPLPMT
jgi:RecB family exonuclease